MPLFTVAFVLAYALTYLVLVGLFTLFFGRPLPRFSLNTVYAGATLVALVAATFLVTNTMHDAFVGNRILHAIGGGCVMFLGCFFAARESGVQISRFQFFVFSFLVVTALGVGNELLELFVQSTTHLVFAETVTDTWLDLFSNTIGALVSGAALTFWYQKS